MAALQRDHYIEVSLYAGPSYTPGLREMNTQGLAMVKTITYSSTHVHAIHTTRYTTGVIHYRGEVMCSQLPVIWLAVENGLLHQHMRR